MELKYPEYSAEGSKRYLESPFIQGIGEVLASRIVDKFGKNTAGIILEHPDRLSEIPGLNENKIHDIVAGFKEPKHPLDLLIFLYSTGLSDADIDKILSHYGKLTEKVILYDPYEMVEDVWKFSFFSADKIGRTLGIPTDDPRRLRGALLTAVKIYAERGNIFATEDEAVKLTADITGASIEPIKDQLEKLIEDERLIRSHNGIYLPVYYKAEKEGAEKIAALMRASVDSEPITVKEMKDREGHELSPEQLNAIETVLNNPVTIITGGPGTGKTTAVKGIIELLIARGQKVILAAPTGRAAKRMTELTGYEAKTIHRLLGYSQGKGYKNKSFEADILIIDEASMLEQVLFNHLLQAIGGKTKVVLVGDTDQLPPIGAGDVLKEMIDSGSIPVISLSENFRQNSGSMIAANALAIKEGKYPHGVVNSDFIIVNEESAGNIKERILKLVSDELPSRNLIDPKDIQVVTPQQEGPLGAKQLNIDIQQRVNPSGPEIKKGMKILRLGDRVMQTTNSSSRGIYNGETGWVSNVDPVHQTLEVTFHDGKVSEYTRDEMGELSLAYATTVHKLQGSETDYMVMPVSVSHRPMLYRNLLYTAVSRARRLCVLVGEEKAINTAVNNRITSTRHTNFKRRLRRHIPAKSCVI